MTFHTHTYCLHLQGVRSKSETANVSESPGKFLPYYAASHSRGQYLHVLFVSTAQTAVGEEYKIIKDLNSFQLIPISWFQPLKHKFHLSNAPG
jgi:hypothetical protein